MMLSVALSITGKTRPLRRRRRHPAVIGEYRSAVGMFSCLASPCISRLSYKAFTSWGLFFGNTNLPPRRKSAAKQTARFHHWLR